MGDRRALTALAALGWVAVAAPAGAADNRSRPFPAERTCSAIDDSYVRLAEETGGLLLPLSGDVLAANAEAIGKLLAARLESIDLVRGTIEGGHRRLEIPVDEGATRLVVSLCVDHEERSELIGPEGRALAAGAPGFFRIETGRFRIFSVERPAPGAWRVAISGSGRYLAQAKIEGGVSLGDVAVEVASDTALRLRVGGEPKSVRAALVDRDGAWLRDVPLRAERGAWSGRAATPASPFRVQVRGEDRGGRAFRRTDPPMREPRPPATPTAPPTPAG